MIHAFGQEIIDFVAGDATAQAVKDLALTHLGTDGAELPGGGDCADRQRRCAAPAITKIPLLTNGGMNILNILISSVLIYGIFSLAGAGVCRRRAWADHCPPYWRDSHDLGADGGPQSGAAAVAEGLLQTL